MDRKGIIAIALSIAVLIAWQFKTQKELREWQEWQKAHPAEAAQTAAPLASSSPGSPAVTPGMSARPTPAVPAEAPRPEVPEEKQKIAAPTAEYTFTNLGGGIASVSLLKHEGEKPGEPMVLNAFGTHPIGAVLTHPDELSRDAYTVTAKGNVVVCEWTNPATGLQITKTFTLPQETKGAGEYSVGLEVAFSNKGAAPLENPNYYIFTGAVEPVHPHELATYTGFDWYRAGKATFIDVHWFDPSKVPLIGTERSPGHSNYTQAPGGVVWAGVRNQYFTSLIATTGTSALGAWANRITIKADDKEVQGIQGALGLPGFKLNPGETSRQNFTIFAGPKEYRLLKELGQGEAEIMNFGMFKIISIFLLRSMNKLHDWMGSYAIAIIILTFIVRGALWPVQQKATNSMKRMQLLSPKMAELKEKYKDDPTRMNQELMKLYKDFGVNPFAGCLPMLIQIPIFFGFYSMLGTAVELRNSHFLWVRDLSQPDTIFHLAGIPVNILPLLMAGSMLWQMQLTPKTGDPTQQKMFMFMPLVFVLFTYNYASALALYYTVQNILSIVQLYVTRNQMAPALERAGAKTKKQRRAS